MGVGRKLRGKNEVAAGDFVGVEGGLVDSINISKPGEVGKPGVGVEGDGRAENE